MQELVESTRCMKRVCVGEGGGGAAQSWWGAGVARSHGLLHRLKLTPQVQSLVIWCFD
jgi:hypothetical protein